MYKLPKLNFEFQDVEPYIDIHTIGLHYFKHEQIYLDKLNKLLDDEDYDYKYGINELVYHIDEFSKDKREDILFNLGGVLNHNLYFRCINLNGFKPDGELKKVIVNKYGSFDLFWKKFKEIALSLKGSGYTFLVLRNDMNIDIINLSNQETPLSYGFIPLFNIDMWEHAYYMNYENDKARYIDNFLNIADFSYASEVYEKAMYL
ncbi:MAG: superoxide dismutase [Bacilli bacterium]|nr:superoxide dismutase [Bacilli bacterium]